MEVQEHTEFSRITELESRLAEAQAQLAEARETLAAIRNGEVDALVVDGPDGDQVFTLQGAESPYRFLIEEMNEGALLLASDGTVLYANPRFARFVGEGLEHIAGSAWQRFFPPDEHGRLAALLATATRAGVREEFRLLPASGSPRAVQLSVNFMNGVEGFAVIVTDLTERKTAEEALLASNAKLREMVHELEQFSYSITHDMRAPLRAMHSFAGLLERECPDCTSPQKPFLDRIKTAANRLDLLIQDSLSYARAVRQDLPLEPVKLAELLQGLVDTYPNLHSDSANIEIAGDWPVVLGNHAALTQCFANLLDNAVKFVAPGVRPHVRLWAEQRNGRLMNDGVNSSTEACPPSTNPSIHQSISPSIQTARLVRVWVEDNGIGISKDFQPRIFDMFQRVSNAYDGTGIGLAIVRKVVQRMNGRVGVESDLGRGSRFWVELATQ